MENKEIVWEMPGKQPGPVPKGRWIRTFLWRLVLILFISSVLQVLYYRFMPPLFTTLMFNRKADAVFNSGKSSDLKYRWRSIGRISPHLRLAVVAAEDQQFPHHFGIDVKAMKKAYRYNRKGRKIKGASTISQQVAKNLFLWHGRSYARKAAELYYTFLIELLWSKERILEMYLNIAETGNLVFGAEAGARYYFKKPAASLSRAEAAAIAVILPNPRKYSVKNPSPYIARKKNWVLNQMNRLGRDHLGF